MAAAGQMSLNDLLASMPKMMRIADDMHNMTSYINDLRILTIVMVVAGVLGGIGFLLFKLSRPSGEETPRRDSPRQPQYYDDAHYHWTNELHSVKADGVEKMALRGSDKSTPPPLKGNPDVV